MEEKYIICEDSLEGIFTAVYDAYALREGHDHLHVQVGETDNYRLFATYLHSQPDFGKTEKVVRTLKERLGEHVYGSICRAQYVRRLPTGRIKGMRSIIPWWTVLPEGTANGPWTICAILMWQEPLRLPDARPMKCITNWNLSDFRS